MPRQAIPAAQNLILHSQAFGSGWTLDASGTGSAPTVTDNYTTAPDGTQTAARVQMNKGAGSGFSRISQSSAASYDANQLYTASIWLKTNDGTSKTVALRLGSVSTDVTVTGSWQRFTFQIPAGNGSGLSVQMLLWDVQSTSQTADLAAWGAQLVKANWAGPYAPTTSAVVNTGSIRNTP